MPSAKIGGVTGSSQFTIVPAFPLHDGGGGTIDVAQWIAGHQSFDTTKIYDRSRDRLTLEEIVDVSTFRESNSLIKAWAARPYKESFDRGQS